MRRSAQVALVAGAAVTSGAAAYWLVRALQRKRLEETPRPPERLEPPPARPQPTRSNCDVPHTDTFEEHAPFVRGSKGQVQEVSDQLRAFLVECGATMSYLSMKELTYLPRADEYAIPARVLWPRLARTVRVWERIRSRFRSPIEITSAYRPADYNRRVDGTPRSLHVLAAALDFTVEPPKRERLARVALEVFHERGTVDAVGLGIYGYPQITHLHLDTGREYRMIEQTPRWRAKYPPIVNPLPLSSGAWSWRGWSGKTIGSGLRPVLVLHGMAATNAQLEPLLKRATGRFWLVEGQVPASAGGWNYFETRSNSASFAAGLTRATDDIIPLVDAIRKRVGVRPYVLGYSQGAHIALSLAVRGQAGVVIAAAGDLPESLWPSQEPAPAALQRLHIIHGANDTVVPPARARRLASELAARGWPVSYIEVPGAGHRIEQLWPAVSKVLEKELQT